MNSFLRYVLVSFICLALLPTADLAKGQRLFDSSCSRTGLVVGAPTGGSFIGDEITHFHHTDDIHPNGGTLGITFLNLEFPTEPGTHGPTVTFDATAQIRRMVEFSGLPGPFIRWEQTVKNITIPATFRKADLTYVPGERVVYFEVMVDLDEQPLRNPFAWCVSTTQHDGSVGVWISGGDIDDLFDDNIMEPCIGSTEFGTYTMTANGTWQHQPFYHNYEVFFSLDDACYASDGDANGDGVLNLLDVSYFLDAISRGDSSPNLDFNCDGIVNLLDVQGFIDAFGGS